MSLNRFLPLEIRRHQNVQEPEARKLLNYEFLLCDKSHFNSSICPHPEIGLRMFSMNIFYVNDVLVNEDSEVLIKQEVGFTPESHWLRSLWSFQHTKLLSFLTIILIISM